MLALAAGRSPPGLKANWGAEWEPCLASQPGPSPACEVAQGASRGDRWLGLTVRLQGKEGVHSMEKQTGGSDNTVAPWKVLPFAWPGSA